MAGFKKISLEQREQILSEVKEVGNIPLVAKKHNISSKTIYNWTRSTKNTDQFNQSKEIRALNKKLKDAELENLVLKELLKKTYQRWESAEKL
jgi:transposase